LRFFLLLLLLCVGRRGLLGCYKADAADKYQRQRACA
jgi:hypothetical protein